MASSVESGSIEDVVASGGAKMPSGNCVSYFKVYSIKRVSQYKDILLAIESVLYRPFRCFTTELNVLDVITTIKMMAATLRVFVTLACLEAAIVTLTQSLGMQRVFE
jgi:hypothetical protein